jgi:hypothetical protein
LSLSKEKQNMQNQDPIQHSLSFVESDQSDNIDNLFTQKDMSRFGKGREMWGYINHQYAYSVEFDSKELI